MGLDAVELIMDVEETFGIKIEDKDAETMRTVNDMHQYVLNKIETAPNQPCASQKAFYVLRKNLITTFNIPRNTIRPDTTINSLFPRSTRKQQWLTFTQNTPLNLPSLDYPVFIYLCIPALMLLAAVTTGFTTNAFLGILVFIPSFFIINPIVFTIASPLKTALLNINSMGDLSNALIRLNPDQFTPYTPKDIWNILIDLISTYYVDDKTTIKPESKFVEDLGLG